MSLAWVRLSINIVLSAQWLEYHLEYFHNTAELCKTGYHSVSCTRTIILTFLFSYSP